MSSLHLSVQDFYQEIMREPFKRLPLVARALTSPLLINAYNQYYALLFRNRLTLALG